MSNKITCRKVRDYMIPNIILPHEETKVELGLWGMSRKEYLMNNKRVLFNIMLTKGTLFQYLAEVDRQAEDLFFRIIDDMAKDEGITEQLKAKNQLEWVAHMNNIHARAREIIYLYTKLRQPNSLDYYNILFSQKHEIRFFVHCPVF